MSKDDLITCLNEDLQTEFQSIVQYTRHVAIVKGAEYQAITDELAAHLSQELDHAKLLAQQIDFLGGEPTGDVPDIPEARDSRHALELDLDLERRQLERYRQRVQQAEELGFPDVAENLRPILQQTQDHVRELEDALGA